MTRFLYLLVMLSITCRLTAQLPEENSEAERQADSILRQFRNADQQPDADSEFQIDSSALEKADQRNMERFLNIQRDLEKEKQHKRILYFTTGVALLIVLIIGFRRKKRGDRSFPPQ